MSGARAKAAAIVAFIVGLALAAYCGYVFCVRVLPYGYHAALVICFYIVEVVAVSVVCDIVHEMAHFLVGKWLKLGTKMPSYRPLASSSVEVNPRVSRGLRARMIATSAVGLITSLAFISLGACALAIECVSPVFIAVLPYSSYSLILNAAPVEYRSGKTDGLVLCELIALSDSARVMLAVLRVQGLLNEGTALKDIDKSLLFGLPQLPEDDINFIVLTQLRYEYFSAVGDEEQAKAYLGRYNELKQYLPEGYADMPLSDKAEK